MSPALFLYHHGVRKFGHGLKLRNVSGGKLYTYYYIVEVEEIAREHGFSQLISA